VVVVVFFEVVVVFDDVVVDPLSEPLPCCRTSPWTWDRRAFRWSWSSTTRGRCWSWRAPPPRRRFRPSPPGEGACSPRAPKPETTAPRPRAWPGRRRWGETAGGPSYRGQGLRAAPPGWRRRRVRSGRPGGPGGPRDGTLGTHPCGREARRNQLNAEQPEKHASGGSEGPRQHENPSHAQIVTPSAPSGGEDDVNIDVKT